MAPQGGPGRSCRGLGVLQRTVLVGPEGRGPAGIVEPGLDVDESRSRPVGAVGEVPPEGPVGGCWRVRDWVGPAQEGSGGGTAG